MRRWSARLLTHRTAQAAGKAGSETGSARALTDHMSEVPLSCSAAQMRTLCMPLTTQTRLQLNFEEEEEAKREPVKLPPHACS